MNTQESTVPAGHTAHELRILAARLNAEPIHDQLQELMEKFGAARNVIKTAFTVLENASDKEELNEIWPAVQTLETGLERLEEAYLGLDALQHAQSLSHTSDEESMPSWLEELQAVRATVGRARDDMSGLARTNDHFACICAGLSQADAGLNQAIIAMEEMPKSQQPEEAQS